MEQQSNKRAAADYHVEEIRKVARGSMIPSQPNDVKLHAKAATLCGTGEGWFILGNMYDQEGDRITSQRYYIKGAEAGHPECMYNVAVNFDERNDIERARDWYRRAATLLLNKN